MNREDPLSLVLETCLAQLRSGDESARGKILDLCDMRLRELSHRLLGKFAKVRRWDDTAKTSGLVTPDLTHFAQAMRASQLRVEALA